MNDNTLSLEEMEYLATNDPYSLTGYERNVLYAEEHPGTNPATVDDDTVNEWFQAEYIDPFENQPRLFSAEE